MRISFIGGGNMANALIGGLCRQGLAAASIQVVEPQQEARDRLEASWAVRTHAVPSETVLACDVLVLSVKPQHMHAALVPLCGRLDRQVVVSLAAGTRLEGIAKDLGAYRRLVRAMPNTPALIGEGITGLYADPSLTEPERACAEQVLSAAGQTVWVQDEDQIDAITAISGSGPAYVFFFIEALEAAARALGFEAAVARQLALSTFKGASLLAAGSPDSPATLREKVSSKGGTTEAALAVLAAAKVDETLLKAASAAFARGQALALGKP